MRSMNARLLCCLLAIAPFGIARAQQQMAITFDDLPSHGERPASGRCWSR
jgi:hypothetical protein